MTTRRARLLELIGGTPLVQLERIGRGLAVSVLVKCEHLNPGGSIKDRIALAIVRDAEARGALRPGMTLIEATAGNTGVGLALVAATRGYGLVCVMPEKMSVDKRNALSALGAKVVVTVNAPPSSPDNFRNVARRLAEEHGWFLTDQFNNPANPRVHAETTGAEILRQTDGRVGAFVAGAGTGGTISGVGRRLKSALERVRVVDARRLGRVALPREHHGEGVLGARAESRRHGRWGARNRRVHLDTLAPGTRSEPEAIEIRRTRFRRVDGGALSGRAHSLTRAGGSRARRAGARPRRRSRASP
jgi:cysteine synthase